ncbi:MAG: menaquinone biosynthesis decarboxylase [Bacteroidia bacterium]|nr:menaquinone biosynthesis decarboxylase [Bacteroidia bacterium]
MHYSSLKSFINKLEDKNELVRIKEFVNPVLEIAEITDRFSKSTEYGHGGKALLFENTGTQFPLLINAMGSYKRICLALGVNELDEFGKRFNILYQLFLKPPSSFINKLKMFPGLMKISSLLPKILSGRGASQQVVMNQPDIAKLPVLKCWPMDGGRFITLPMVITKDPETGIRNVGMYRMQVLGKAQTGMHWHIHKGGAAHFEKYKKLKKKMPVVVALGGDPACTFSATAPLPENIDEFFFAGFLRQKRIELVQCLTQDIEAPTDADFIIEGYIDPLEDFITEGPFGDHTGFYSLPAQYPLFHVTCITHRKDAVYPATIVGIPPMEDFWLSKATERIFLPLLKLTLLPEIVDIDLPAAGVTHNLAIIKIRVSYPGQAQKVMNALWSAGQMMFNKVLIITAQQADIHDYTGLAVKLLQSFDPAKDVYFSRGPLDILDHSSNQPAFGGKMCLDTTRQIDNVKHEELKLKSEISPDKILQLYPELSAINISLVKSAIPVLIASIVKSKAGIIKNVFNNLIKIPELTDVKIFIIVDHYININDINRIIWYCLANIDPVRDCSIPASPFNSNHHLCIDGTKKTKEADNFPREWPDIIASAPETIEAIDKKWDMLNLGIFLPSPGLKYKVIIPSF